MTDTVIGGVAEAPQGRTEWASSLALETWLVESAAHDAQVELDHIDALISVPPRAADFLVDAAAVSEALGLRPRLAFSVEAGGTAPILMLGLAVSLIATGAADTVAVVAADLPLTQVGRRTYGANLANSGGPVHPILEAPFGPTAVTLFALMASRHMAVYGTTEEHLAAVALQDRQRASSHPNAHMREPLSPDQYQEARYVSTPLRLFDCAPVSDGGGALVLTSRQRSASPRPVTIDAVGQATSHLHLTSTPSLSSFDIGPLMDSVLAEAGVIRADLRAAFVYDCFTIAMLLSLEALGFAEPGSAGPMFADGYFDVEGTLPVNTHGGLLSHGHPGRAGGMGNVIEAVLQVRGDSGDRQLDQCDKVLVHGMTGAFAQQAVAILGS